jgi:hypothetical protein
MKSLITALAALVLAAPALQAQVPAPGPKAMALGGAFVASQTDATALWGNPASLAQCRLGCSEFFGGAAAADANEFARRLRRDFDGLDLSTFSGGSAQLSRLVSDLRSFATPGTGVVASGSAGAGYAIRGFGLGVGETVYSGVFPTIDLDHVHADDFVDNTSRATLRGLEAREVRIGYSTRLGWGLSVGVDVRYIRARTYFDTETFSELAKNPGSVALDALKKNRVTSSRFAYDAGVLYQPAPKLRLGLVGLNLNEPEFDSYDGRPVPLPRAFRAGASFAPLTSDGVVLTVDADLNKQKTLVPGLSSRRIAGGVQLYFLRLGAYRDLAAVDPHWAYTGGVHFAAPLFSFAISGVYAPGDRDIGVSADVRVKL